MKPTSACHAVSKQIGQFVRFGLVGIFATVTHVALFVTLIEWLGIGTAGANVLAYLAACLVGYSGHSAWTFRVRADIRFQLQPATLTRFLIASLCGLGLNALVVHIVVEVLKMPYLYAIPFMATIVPVTVFALNRYWVFSGPLAVKPRGPDK